MNIFQKSSHIRPQILPWFPLQLPSREFYDWIIIILARSFSEVILFAVLPTCYHKTLHRHRFTCGHLL